MVKRLHLGRAAAAGVLAARLAQRGFTGPSTVLEGPHGFLQAYCRETDTSALTAALGERFETLSICFKNYPCHITAHNPVHTARLLQALHGFSGADVETVTVEGSAKMAALHGNRRPGDAVAAQYSIAFCVAAALLYNPADPSTFTQSLGRPELADLCDRVEVLGSGAFPSAWSARTTIRLRDGRCFSAQRDSTPGFPTEPFTDVEKEAKFMALTSAMGEASGLLFARLQVLEQWRSLDWLAASTNH